MLKKISALVCFQVIASFVACSQTGWQAVPSFGTNPGNLGMYSYVPAGMGSPAPLVVAMHGCTQNALTYAAQSGWNKLADSHLFYVVYPEQNASNNSSTCFNWFMASDQNRNQGEALSIRQMVDYMKAHYNIDTARVFVTGLSAGACMTNVMLACYPDVFSAGAVMAGAPFKSATNATQASAAMYGYVSNTPVAWGDSVRHEFTAYTGPYPRVAVFHGSLDPVVSPVNEAEVMKQWTNVHGADQTADQVVSAFNGNAYVTKNGYNDNSGQEVVQTFTISGMGHAIALDTGSCYQQCGKTGTYASEVYLSSSFWAAYFFNILDNNPVSISGQQAVAAGQSGLSYSVPAVAGTSYMWTVPAGASITSGQGTHQVTVGFGTVSGYVAVTETSSGCELGPFNLLVTVSGVTAIGEADESQVRAYPNPCNGLVYIQSQQPLQSITVINSLGETVTCMQLSSHEVQIDLSAYPPGLYLLVAKSPGRPASNRKLILQ